MAFKDSTDEKFPEQISGDKLSLIQFSASWCGPCQQLKPIIEKISNESFKIRTYERGVENETLACGTGSTASAICMNYLGKSQSNNITMKCRGGDLKVEFISKDNLFTNISITGPAKLVFEDQIDI